jgi:hypothetical protein
VTQAQKEAASQFIAQAINSLQAPQNGNTFGAGPDELVPLNETNRRTAVRSLLAAVAQLIPDDHPDAPFRAQVETRLNSFWGGSGYGHRCVSYRVSIGE